MHRDDPNRLLGAQDAWGRNRVRLAREHAPGLRTGTLSLLTLSSRVFAPMIFVSDVSSVSPEVACGKPLQSV